MLWVKFEKGLFDRPYTDPTRYQTAYLHEDALALSREAAAKSCVLLKNENQVLPLSPRARKFALIGPLADNAQEIVGTWHSRAHTNELVSLADAMRAVRFRSISVVRGCALFEPGVSKSRVISRNFLPLKGSPTGPNEITDAVALAKASDVVVLALGEPLDWSGEDASRSELGLPGLQQDFLTRWQPRASRWWWCCSMADRWRLRKSSIRPQRFWKRGFPARRAPTAWQMYYLAGPNLGPPDHHVSAQCRPGAVLLQPLQHGTSGLWRIQGQLCGY